MQGDMESYADIRDGVRRLCAVFPGEYWRKLDRERAYPSDFVKALTQAGFLAALIPEEFGGSGLGFFEAALIAQALGRVAAPAPFLGTAIMAATALLEGGTDAQKREWLPRIAAGDLKIGVALSEAVQARDGAGVTFAGGTLTGTALGVIDGLSADLFLVAAGPATLALVPRDAPGVTVAPMTTLDKTRGIAELALADVKTNALIGAPGGAGECVRRVIDAGRVALAADMLGAEAVMIERAVAYSLERKQFNRPIGSFQAIKHACAEMVADLEPARALVWYAAHAHDNAPDEAAVMACHAKAHLGEIGRSIANNATLAHGGMGFTDLMGLHYWFKRIHVDRALLGGPERLRHEAAVLQGWAA
jgi:alkylation response protein AidB-like acyl-CoA dehydrogenase